MKLADLALRNAECKARRPAVSVTHLATGISRVVPFAHVENDPLADTIMERVRLGKGAVVEAPDGAVFVDVQVPAVRLLAIGAVHISQALATMASLLDLEVTVIDPRTAFATPERFPGVTLMPDWPDDVLPRIGLDAYTAVALLTHDPKIDDQALVRALQARCFYIGALGSRKTHGKRLERMRERGFGDEALARIRAPIGLDIGAVSPAEIAVSVLAEIVAARRSKPMRGAETGVGMTA